MSDARGKVYLVGAGPGDPGLITVRGMDLLRAADVVIHDRLIPQALLAEVRPNAVVIDAGKSPGHHRLTQDDINALLVEHARADRVVVRLKGGDPFVFGRGYEEWIACRAAGIHCEVVPGVTSAVAGPASANIPITHRGVARSFAVVTARTGECDNASDLDYPALARLDTLVVLMGRAALREVAANLTRAGKSADTPAACVQDATTPRQRVVVADLASIADRADEAGLAAPMVMVVGDVARFAADDSSSAGLVAPAPDESCPPLSGLRIVLTGSPGLNEKLSKQLGALGATVLDCPLASIRYGCEASREAIDNAIRDLRWMVFASSLGVQGFEQLLIDTRPDLRVFDGVRVAAVGCGTAKALRECGIRCDLVPKTQSAAGLLAELGSSVRGGRLLLLCGNLSRDELADGLRNAGAFVERLVVYHNEPAALDETVLAELRRGYDAVMFASPSAVQRFGDLNIRHRGACIACIGPTTARAAEQAGLSPEIVAADHSAEGLAHALVDHFSASEVQT